MASALRANGETVPTWEARVPAWRQQAACRGLDPGLFVPNIERDENVTDAVAVCAGCPVRGDCLAAALADPNLVGVWGGTTTRERRKLRAVGVA